MITELRPNQEATRWHLEVIPEIVAVVDRDGDVWVRDGDCWRWTPRDDDDEGEMVERAEDVVRIYGPLRVAWVER